MDGRNVNLKFLQLIQKDREENQQYGLIDIGSCGLHTIHNAFKTGAEETGKLKRFSKQPIKSFMTLHRKEKITLLSLVRISLLHHFVQEGW